MNILNEKISNDICLFDGCIWQKYASKSQQLMASANATEVEIYTAAYCSDCKLAKAYLETHNIAFDEHDVENDLVHRQEFYARGGKGVPMLFVKGQIMHGFDEQKFEYLRSQ